MSRDGLEVLGPERLARRSAEVFPTAYTTLLSIAQGAALITLVLTAVDLYRAVPAAPWLVTLEVVVTALSIIIVSYMYTWFVVVFRWAPGVLDTVIPLALGAAEIVLAYVIDSPGTWIASLIALMIVGGLAFSHSLWRSDSMLFADKESYDVVRRALRTLRNLCAVGGVILALGYLLLVAQVKVMDTATYVLVASVLTIGMFCLLIARSESALRGLYRINRVRRWPQSEGFPPRTYER